MQVDGTQSISEHAIELMRRYGRNCSPRAYEVWYTFVTGLKPSLNDELKRIVATSQALSATDTEKLYDAHLSNDRLLAQAQNTGQGLLTEIDQVTGLLDAALGSTERYGESLKALSDDLSGPVERTKLKDVLEGLLDATREVVSANTTLESRLRDSLHEVEALSLTLAEVRQETLLDPLTGIANRRHFDAMVERTIDDARRASATLALVVIDIDEFKRFNDVYGHLTGDQVLRLVAAAMRENVEAANSTLARFGGEEFAMLLPRVSAEDAFACAEKIRGNVMGRELLKRSTGESLGRVTVSLGVAMFRPDDNAMSLMERADACMYEAKRAGRNRTVVDGTPASEISDAA